MKLSDTAGIREGQGLVETLGIERSLQAMADADLTLVVLDLSAPVAEPDRQLMARSREHGRWILVGNKCDLPRHADTAEPIQLVSALTGEGIDSLRDAIFDASPEAERNADADRAGVAIRIVLDRIEGRTPDGPIEIVRS